MPLTTGARLGPYEIVSPIGAGGMGEVYKAKDTRLDRSVAVKVLPAHLSDSAEFRQRFEREARAISALTHPHICTLHDIGREGSVDYLVMELLEGETLSNRLLKGPLSMDQALQFGIQICDALEKAHRQGIVHRDLKPGNIMLTKSGVKLLDFGLAKLAPPGSGVHSDSSHLATEAQASVPLTERGTILGTYQYMSPEQLEGGEADARSDIFALGAILYEMATGRKAFTGKSQASLIGSILRDDPTSVSEVAPMIPPAFSRVIRTCLAKDPEDRFQTTHDVRLQLQWVAEGGSQAGLPAPVAARRKSREKLAWALAGAAVVLAGAFAFGFMRRAPAPPRMLRFEIPMPSDAVAIDAPRISPDGKVIAFNGTDSTGRTRIWIRPLNALVPQPLPGTEGTTRPFWSPDSRFLAFFAEGKLKKIDVTGGPPQKICDAATGSDGSWSPEGVILFDGTGSDPIWRVPAAGGSPVVAVKHDASRKETQLGWPEFLPDGRHFLYMATNPEGNEYRVGVLDSTDSEPIGPAQTMVTYAPPGYLLFVRDRTLVAQAFDWKSRKTTGEARPIAEQIGTDSVGLARFSVSRDGVLAYRTGELGGRLVWLDRSGKEISTEGATGEMQSPSLSRAGDRIAMNVADTRAGNTDVWIRDLKRGVSTRLTFEASNDIAAIWSPDGTRVAYSTDRNGPGDIMEKAATGVGAEKVLVKDNNFKYPNAWSNDSRYLVYSRRDAKTGWDVWALPTFGDGKPLPLVQSPFNDNNGSISPDGRYLLYQSGESGRGEVYVQSFPGPGGRWQVSSEGGVDASWRADGREIFFRSPSQQLMAVDVIGGAEFQAGIPRPLFSAAFLAGTMRGKYAAAPDGQKFLVLAPLGRDAMTPTTVVVNWSADLAN